MKSNDLLLIWATALEREAEGKIEADGCILRIKFENPRIAEDARIELYRIRTNAKKKSKQGVGPDDPRYDTSPWDGLTIRHPGSTKNDPGPEPYLAIYRKSTIPGWGFEILDTVDSLSEPEKPKKSRKLKEPKDDEA